MWSTSSSTGWPHSAFLFFIYYNNPFFHIINLLTFFRISQIHSVLLPTLSLSFLSSTMCWWLRIENHRQALSHASIVRLNIACIGGDHYLFFHVCWNRISWPRRALRQQQQTEQPKSISGNRSNRNSRRQKQIVPTSQTCSWLRRDRI